MTCHRDSAPSSVPRHSPPERVHPAIRSAEAVPFPAPVSVPAVQRDATLRRGPGQDTSSRARGARKELSSQPQYVQPAEVWQLSSTASSPTLWQLKGEESLRLGLVKIVGEAQISRDVQYVCAQRRPAGHRKYYVRGGQ